MRSRILRCSKNPTPKPNRYVSIGVSQVIPLPLNQSLTSYRSRDRYADIVDTGRGEVMLVFLSFCGHMFC